MNDYMLKEINEQPSLIGDIATSTLFDNFNMDLYFNKENDIKILLVGCGSSYNASLLIRDYFNNDIDIKYGYDVNEEDMEYDIIIYLSQSGSTYDIVNAAKLIYEKDKRPVTISLTNNREAELNKYTDYHFNINVGEEKAITATKSFIGEVLYGIYICYDIYRSNQYVVKEDILKYKVMLSYLSAMSKTLLSSELALEEFIDSQSKILSKCNSIILITKQISELCGREIALKFEETTYIPTLYVRDCEVKHGPLAIVDDKVGLLILNYEQDGLDNNLIWKISYIGNILKQPQIFNWNIYKNGLDKKDFKLLYNLFTIIYGQRLVYEVAKKKGIDVNNLRNLSKCIKER